MSQESTELSIPSQDKQRLAFVWGSFPPHNLLIFKNPLGFKSQISEFGMGPRVGFVVYVWIQGCDCKEESVASRIVMHTICSVPLCSCISRNMNEGLSQVALHRPSREDVMSDLLKIPTRQRLGLRSVLPKHDSRTRARRVDWARGELRSESPVWMLFCEHQLNGYLA